MDIMTQEQQEHTVSQDDHDIRLDRWFKRHYPGFPHAMLEKYLRKGLIRLDGKKAKTSDRVQAGQVVRCPPLAFEPPARHRRQLSDEDISEVRKWVLYKDASVIIINKPFGLAVQGGTKISRSLDDLLDGLIFDAKERPKLIHRIDRDTSGVLVLARNSRIAAQLAKGFAGKSIDKTYWALVRGAPLPPVGIVDLPLNKIARGDNAREQVEVDEDEGKYAITEYRTIDALARKFALMELKPLTGRMHQLRVHMAAIDCPIVGDHKYGGGVNEAESLGVQNILHLHARRIVIPALQGRKKIDVTAPLPKHMVESFRALGLDVPKK
jgi:23S rRNA pseudouridine955/2504/2580 synthase